MRKSNFELLRIVSMFLIVMSHCDDRFGLADLYSTTLGANKVITDWLDAGGQIGVGCFLLLSGYFMIEQKVTAKKILKLAGEVWFYTIGSFVIWMIASLVQGNYKILCSKVLKEAILAFFPITFSEYWFVTAYIILMILSPFCNKLIFLLEKREYQALLTSLVIIFVALQGGIPNVFKGIATGRIVPVMIYYFIAGYIKRFVVVRGNNSRKHISVAILLYFILIASFSLLTLIGVSLNSSTLIEHSDRYRQLQSPIVLAICLELFIGFMQMNIQNSHMINEIAGCTFGVYLIQSNRIVRNVIAGMFPIYKETRSFYILIYSIGAILIIYVGCTIIDLIRKKVFEKKWIQLLDLYIVPLQERAFDKSIQLFTRVKTKLFRFYEGN